MHIRNFVYRKAAPFIGRAWGVMVNDLVVKDRRAIETNRICRATYDAGYKGRGMKNPHGCGTLFYRLWALGEQDRASEDGRV
jgi:hypothetical protein